MMFHAEVVHRDGVAVGYIRAASYGHTLGGAVGLAMIATPDGAPLDAAWIEGGTLGGRHRGHAVPGDRVAEAALRSGEQEDQGLGRGPCSRTPPGSATS